MASGTDGSGNDTRGLLRRVLVSNYQSLLGILTRRLGSADNAGDALQEVWLKLERGGEFAVPRDPVAYLMRSAINVDHQRRKSETLHARLLDERAPDILPDMMDPEQEVAKLSDWAAIKRAIARLPERRQAIFLAVWAEERPLLEVATQHGVTVRTIQTELQRALEGIAAEMRKT